MTAKVKAISLAFLLPVEAAVLFLVAVLSALTGLILAFLTAFFRYSEIPKFDLLSATCENSAGCWTVERGLLLASPAILSAIVYLVSFALFRCPHCQHRLLALIPKKIHPEFKSMDPLGTRTTILLEAYLYRKFTCPSCGDLCEIRKAE